ncbi:MAG: hypothetical protein ACI4MZ_03230 [Christensenellales bacterium]
MVVTRWIMNYDVNTIASLMQYLSPKTSRNDGVENENTRVGHTGGLADGKTLFYCQNGLGEQIRIDPDGERTQDKKASPFSELINNLAKQNPALSFLSAMQGGKDAGAILPLVMSLMQSKKSEKSDKKTELGADGQRQSERDQASCGDDCNRPAPPDSSVNPEHEEDERMQTNEAHCNSIRKTEKEKTQRSVFEPIAFAGYEIISKVCSLLRCKARLCR